MTARVSWTLSNPNTEKLVLQKGGAMPLGCVNLKANEGGSDQ